MNNRRLRRKIIRRAKWGFRNEEMGAHAYVRAIAVANDENALNELQRRIKLARMDPWSQPDNLVGADWRTILSNLWDWFEANWPDILKIILTIAPLLLENPRNANS